MTSYETIIQAASVEDYDESIRRVKGIAADAIREADRDAQLIETAYFNHSYVPDFVLRWQNGKERFVYLRASSYAEELEDDIRILGDKRPMFVQLSEFRQYSESSVDVAVDRLNRSAGSARSLVASVPGIGLLDESPRTGPMLSSLVMRGGRGVVRDEYAAEVSRVVEEGFTGALEANSESTAQAISVVENLLDPPSAAEFSQIFEAAWVSAGAHALDFPGAVTSLGETLSSDMLKRLMGIVGGDASEFWQRLGNSVDLDTFTDLHLVGNQPALQSIMKTAVTRLSAKRCEVRETFRSDQESDPFFWQVEGGVLSLRGAGHQAWLGRAGGDAGDRVNAPTLNSFASRASAAGVEASKIGVTDREGLVVTFTSASGDVATDEVVEKVSNSLGTAVRVTDAVVQVDGKNVAVDYNEGSASLRTKATASVSGLTWAAWNLIVGPPDPDDPPLGPVIGLTNDDEDN